MKSIVTTTMINRRSTKVERHVPLQDQKLRQQADQRDIAPHQPTSAASRSCRCSVPSAHPDECPEQRPLFFRLSGSLLRVEDQRGVEERRRTQSPPHTGSRKSADPVQASNQDPSTTSCSRTNPNHWASVAGNRMMLDAKIGGMTPAMFSFSGRCGTLTTVDLVTNLALCVIHQNLPLARSTNTTTAVTTTTSTQITVR